MKRRNFFTKLLLTGFLGTLLCSGVVFSVTAEVSQPEKITVSDFNTTAWEQKNVPMTSSEIAFTSQDGAFETTVASKEAYSGSYSVEFAGGKTSGNNGASIQMVVALGAEDNTSVIPMNPTISKWNVPAGDDTIYLGFAGTWLGVFDRDMNQYTSLTQHSGTLFRDVYNFYTGMSKAFSDLSYKLEVVDGETEDVLKISFISSTKTETVSITLPSQGLADGYMKISQNLCDSYTLGGQPCGISNYALKNLAVDGEWVAKSELNVLGKEDLVSITNNYNTSSVKLEDAKYDSQYLISNFTIDDSAVNDGEKVFSLQYSGQRFANENETTYWGLVLGVDDNTGDLSTGTEIKYNRLCNFVGSLTNGIAHKYHSTKTANALETFTYTVSGYKGGKVEILYNCNRPDKCTGDTVVYENVDFNGKVAFKLFNDSGLEGGYWNLNSVNFNGYAKYATYYTLTTIVDGNKTTQTLESGSTPTITVPTKEGYEFKGWLYSDGDETNVSKPVDFTIASLEEDVTIEAIFVKTCNLVITVDGQTTNKTCSIGGTVSGIEPQVKEGYVFIGWKFTEGDAASVYKKADISSVTLNEDATLEALFVDMKVLGAQIKVYGRQGLRFVTEISTESKHLLESLGVSVAYGTDLTCPELGSLTIPCENWLTENRFTAVVTGFDKNDVYLTYQFTAKAYVMVDGVKYYANEETRSIYSVAQDASADYKAEQQGEYIYNIGDKWYRYDYTQDQLDYIQGIINKCQG